MARREAGQGLVEYVMLLLVVAGLVSLLNRMMPGALNALERPLRDGFVRAYKFGDPKACGLEAEPGTECTGEPKRHPRYFKPDNFRLFGRGPGR